MSTISATAASILESSGVDNAPTMPRNAPTPFLVFPAAQPTTEESRVLGASAQAWMRASRLIQEGFDIEDRPLHYFVMIRDIEKEPDDRGYPPIVATLISDEPMTDESGEPLMGRDLELGVSKALAFRDRLLNDPNGAFDEGWTNLV